MLAWGVRGWRVRVCKDVYDYGRRQDALQDALHGAQTQRSQAREHAAKRDASTLPTDKRVSEVLFFV